jgi:hypothetical protein
MFSVDNNTLTPTHTYYTLNKEKMTSHILPKQNREKGRRFVPDFWLSRGENEQQRMWFSSYSRYV